MVQSFAVKCSEGKVDLAQLQSTRSVHELALKEASSNMVGSNFCSAMINYETALFDASSFAGLHIAAFEATAWISDTRAACRASAWLVSSQFMMVLSDTCVLTTQFDAVPAMQHGVSHSITSPESAMGNCKVESQIFTKAWATKCVAKKAKVPQISKRCTEGQGVWGWRRATVTVEMQRGTVAQCLLVTMHSVSMEPHQKTDSRFQASTAPSPWFLVLVAVFCLQWLGRLSREARCRGFLARWYVDHRPFSIARPFRALPIVLALMAAALVLLPLVHATSAALIAATAALSAANTAHTALLSSIQVEATATAAATLVHTHIYHMSIYIPLR